MKKLLILTGLILSHNIYSMELGNHDQFPPREDLGRETANACRCGARARFVEQAQDDGLACDTYLNCCCDAPHCTVQYRWSQTGSELRLSMKRKRSLCPHCLFAVEKFEAYERYLENMFNENDKMDTNSDE